MLDGIEQHLAAPGVAPRSIPPCVAEVVQDLELDRPAPATIDDVYRLPPLNRSVARNAISELVRLGRLRASGVRGVYEFIPGRAAGTHTGANPVPSQRVSPAQ